MKIGDLVVIKSIKEIKETLNSDNHCKDTRLYFNDHMMSFCDNTFVIKDLNYAYKDCFYLGENREWSWSHKWLNYIYMSHEESVAYIYALLIKKARLM